MSWKDDRAAEVGERIRKARAAKEIRTTKDTVEKNPWAERDGAIDAVIRRLESEYHLDEDHGWKILLKRLEKCEAELEKRKQRTIPDGQCQCTACSMARAAAEGR